MRYDADNDWPLHILWTDEAHFNLIGNVNIKNFAHWADMNLHAASPVPLFDAKFTMWCGISGTDFLGLYFFEDTTSTGFVTCSARLSVYSYTANYVMPELLQQNPLNDIVWMQDVASPQIAKSVSSVLEQHFGDRIISRHFPFP